MRLLMCCCCCSVAKLHLTLCDPIDCSMPGFPVLHYLSEFAQTHVHWVGDAIQCLFPWSPFSSCPQFVQNQGFFQWVSSSHRVAYIWGWPSSQLIWRPRNEWILQAFITALDGLPSNAMQVNMEGKQKTVVSPLIQENSTLFNVYGVSNLGSSAYQFYQTES